MNARITHLIARLTALAMIAASLVLPAAVMSSAPAGAGPVSPPTITSFAPTKGGFSGGTTVVITGSYLTGATAVRFGGTAATSFTVDSATQITAVTPGHAIGAADVTVTRGSTVTAVSKFVYQPEASLIHEFANLQDLSVPLPFLMTVGPDGSIWGTTFSFAGPSNRIFKLLPDGTAATYEAPVGIKSVQGIVAGADGNLWATGNGLVVDDYNHLLRITPDGTFSDITNAAICDAQYLTTGGDGNLWMVNSSICAGASNYTAVKVTPDGTVTSYPVATSASGFSPGLIFPISGNRLLVAGGNGLTYVIDAADGSVRTFQPCAKNPSDQFQPLNGVMGPDGNLWLTCHDTNSGTLFDAGYLARVTLDSSDISNSTSTYYTQTDNAAIGTPFFMTIGSDGNIWVSQITGPAPSGSSLPFDPSARLLRVSFPDGFATPVVEDFDSDVFFALDLVSSADGFMYLNQFTIFVFYIALLQGGASIGPCYQANSPACAAMGIENFNSLGGVYRIDVGTAAAPVVGTPSVGIDSIDLNWQAPIHTGAGSLTSYRIKYSTHADMSDPTIIDTGDTNLTHTLSSLPAGKYYIRMATTNTIGTGSYSPMLKVIVPDLPEKFPTITATPGDGKVTLNFNGTGWDGGDGSRNGVAGSCECGLSYEYSTDGGTTYNPFVVGASQATIIGLTNFKSYSVKVRAVNTVGNGPASDAVSVTPIADGPTACAATTPSKHRILACWGQLVPTQGTLMRYRAVAFIAGTSTKAASCNGTAADTSCTIHGYNKLLANTIYDIRVRARIRTRIGQVFWSAFTTTSQVTTAP